MGPPPEGALNLAAWGMIREMASADPALNEAAWDELSGIERLVAGDPSERALRRVAGGYLEF
jgi:hypothetical protein